MIVLTRADCTIFYLFLSILFGISVATLLSSGEAAPEVASGEDVVYYRVDLNRAERIELMLVTQVGRVRAEKIIEQRRQGPFTGYEDFFARMPALRTWEKTIRNETRISAMDE